MYAKEGLISEALKFWMEREDYEDRRKKMDSE